jgi:hypothetical protein
LKNTFAIANRVVYYPILQCRGWIPTTRNRPGHLSAGYLSLLQFFLNHRRFLRSEHAERVGQSPAELLTGQSQPHWLEMLGYQRFQRA